MSFTQLQKYALIVIPILFLFFSAPSALDYLFFHADEKRYTDAVIYMMEKDDCFTPYQSDGETPRFKKPIVTYWVLMSGYKIFGVSPLGSRFFFWIAGALLVAVSYLMANSLLKNKKVAILTAFVVASNPLVLMSASRSIPDILLVLFLTVSAWGFLEIMLQDKPSKMYYWMAYLGAALAFETKGIPAAAFAGVSVLFLVLNPWKRVVVKKLLEPVSMFFSVVVALSWFVLMYILHGSGYLDVFFADQVGDRVSSKIVQVAGNGMLGILNLVLFMVPWVLLFFSRPKELRSSIKKSGTDIKAIIGFVITWILLIILMAASVFKFYDRYVLPCIPLFSMFVAYYLVHSKTKFQQTILNVFIGLNLFVLFIAVLTLAFVAFYPILMAGVLVVVVLATVYFGGAFKNVPKEILIANGLLLLYFSAHVLLYPVLTPVPAKQLAVELEKHLENEQDEVYIYGHVGIPANTRVQSRGQLNIVSMDTIYTLPDNSNHLIVFREKEAGRLTLDNYDIYPGSKTFTSIPADKFPAYLRNTILELQDKGKKYLIGKPKQ
ncbi:glycosyltransferase family 39 protein [Prolixibacteraceae bacterium Z1-6]|uniref:Glycosyltransferase family 39 protein n=1 Tax=Draconibacterium aestuarii TaxID=2998507 RepID=A0A9X3J5L8_9BACT|nr:glycosyltransferase family 39 protein [Prolixibacteraceae bacterium Z1-6]